jgi:putative ABC transport system permease protein
MVSRGYFDVLASAPSRGRLFTPADFLPGASPIVLLSATPRQIAMRTALSAGLPVAGGAAIGLACALLSTRALQTLIFGITPHDGPTLCAAVVLVITTAVLAVTGPARRAVRVDPIVALRAE